MGQGFYTVIAYGSVHDFDDGAGGENRYKWVHDAGKRHRVQGRTRYESRQEWLGFFIAENGSGVSRDADGCELFSYEVFDLSKLESEVINRWPKQLNRCMEAYETLQKIAKHHGIDLPTGRLLLVNDYD